MAGTGDTAETALWAQWRALAGQSGATPAPEPDALALAAYAEGRLDETAAEAVELWLVEHPEALADLAAARSASAIDDPSEPVPADLIARASALMSIPEAQIIPFRRVVTTPRGWRAVAAWSGLAASILATSLIGFQLGNDAYLSLSGDATVEAVQQELFDPPGTGILPSTDEESAT